MGDPSNLSEPDWLLRRKLEMRSARMLRFIDLLTSPNPIGCGFLISKEADLIRQALDGIEARWGDRATADAMDADTDDDDQEARPHDEIHRAIQGEA